jgi:hypothetical protein
MSKDFETMAKMLKIMETDPEKSQRDIAFYLIKS